MHYSKFVEFFQAGKFEIFKSETQNLEDQKSGGEISRTVFTAHILKRKTHLKFVVKGHKSGTLQN